MKSILLSLLLLAAVHISFGMGKSGGPHVAWLVEGEELEGPKMVRRDFEAAPDGLVHYFRVTPMVSTIDITGMTPIPANDGTWGAAFYLNDKGWRSLQSTVATDSGKLLRVMLNGRPVEFQRIEKPTQDDHIICIWRGISDAELSQLKRRFKDPKVAQATKKR